MEEHPTDFIRICTPQLLEEDGENQLDFRKTELRNGARSITQLRMKDKNREIEDMRENSISQNSICC